jgi:hypothetical protein
MMKKIRHIVFLLGLVLLTGFSKAQTVKQAEYFWDTDPGQGLGTSLTAVDGNFNEAVEAVFKDINVLPSVGPHTFNMRIKDANNVWSPVFTTAIYIQAPGGARSLNIIQAEYFWDTDPGQGSGTPLLALDGNLNELIEETYRDINILPSVGPHTFNVRVKDANNVWGPLFTTSVYIQTSGTTARNLNIVQAEYFWDTDPGQGSGTPLLASDGNLNELIEETYRNINILPSVGAHTFNVRIKDANNVWGPLFTTSIYIQTSGTTAKNLNVVSGELYFDTDPGYGSGMPLLALDGNFDHVIESIYTQGLPSQITAGLHSMHVRIKDANNTWGPEFVTTVFIDTTIYGVEAIINQGDTLFCANEPLTNKLFVAKNNPLASYSWSVTNGTVSSGQGNDSAYITWTGTFPASLQLIVCEGSTCDTTNKVINTKPISQTTLYDSVCQGLSYNFGGKNLTVTGTYLDTLSAANTCDSIITLNLYVKPVPNLTITSLGNTLTASSGFATYTWYFNGNIISGAATNTYIATQNGGYTVEATTSMGCVTFSSTYNHTIVVCTPTIAITSNQGDTICTSATLTFSASTTNGGSAPMYQWKKNGINVGSGLQNYTPSTINHGDIISCILTSNASCATQTKDTSNLIVVVVGAHNSTTLNQSICQGHNYNFAGLAITSAGTYYDTLTNQSGCDSVVTLHLTIKQTSTSTDVVSSCGSYTWINGTTYTASTNTAKDTLVNSVGCDSVVTLHLTIKQTSTSTDVVSSCGSYTWINGTTYTASTNTAKDTLVNSIGCDSVVTLHLTIKQTSTSTDVVSSCGSYTWINGTTYTASTNTAKDTLVNSIGCDSVVTLHLTIKQTSTSTDVVSSCGSYTWINGTTYTASTNTAKDTLVNSIGCDSVVTLHLTIKQTSTSTDVVSSCGSYTWINGTTYTSSTNTAKDTLINSVGCDSVVTLHLTIKQTSTSTDVVSSCGSYTWINGTTYTASTNTAKDTLVNSIGCDSVVTLHLTIKQTSTSTDVVSSCGSYTWINGTTYTSSTNTAKDTLINSVGCDSVVTLHLTIKQTSTSTDVVSSCGSYTWINGTTYTSSTNTAKDTLINSVGCDSVVTLHLTIKQTSTSTDVVSSCGSYTWINGTTYTSSTNTAKDTLVNSVGCDSIVTLNLTINQVSNISTSVVGITITASNPSATYQWLDCTRTYSVISGEVSQSYIPATNGSYAVELTENGCVDTSACVNIFNVGFEKKEITTNSLLVYPNPSSGLINVEILNKEIQQIELTVYDVSGKQITRRHYTNKYRVTLDLTTEADGVYFIHVTTPSKNLVKRIVIMSRQ